MSERINSPRDSVLQLLFSVFNQKISLNDKNVLEWFLLTICKEHSQKNIYKLCL